MTNVSVQFVQSATVGSTAYTSGQIVSLSEADARYAIISRFAITTPRNPVAVPTDIKRLLAKKADLVSGKVPVNQLPAGSGSGLLLVPNDDGTATLS